MTVDVAASAPAEVTAVAVGAGGEVPPELGVDRAVLAAAGFEGQVGQALALPGTGEPMLVVFGIGDPAELDPARLRDAGAAFAAAGQLARDLANAPPGHLTATRIAEVAAALGLRLIPPESYMTPLPTSVSRPEVPAVSPQVSAARR